MLRRLLSSSSFFSSSSSPAIFMLVSFLFLAKQQNCTYALASALTDLFDDNLFGIGLEDQQDLFSSDTFDDPSLTDIAASEEDFLWASSLQPLDDTNAYLSVENDGLFSSYTSETTSDDDSLLSSAEAGYLPSACLAEDSSSSSSLSGDLFSRSSDVLTALEDYNNDIFAAPATPNFCLQKTPAEEKPLAPLTLPNLLKLFPQQPEDPNDDLLLAPLGTFPRRPVCQGPTPKHVLCCQQEGHHETGITWDCEKCMYFLIHRDVFLYFVHHGVILTRCFIFHTLHFILQIPYSILHLSYSILFTPPFYNLYSKIFTPCSILNTLYFVILFLSLHLSFTEPIYSF